MSEYTCLKCGEEVGMMGHGSSPCPGKLSKKATELGRLRAEARERARNAPKIAGLYEMEFRAGPPRDKEYEEITDPFEKGRWAERIDRAIRDIDASLGAVESCCAYARARGVLHDPPPTEKELREYRTYLEVGRYIEGLSDRLFKIRVK